MTTHLSEEQIAMLAAGEAPEEARAHAASCDACATELSALRDALGLLPSLAQAAAERPATFWRAQRIGISSRIERAPGPHARVAWTVAFAAMLLAAVMLSQPAAPPTVELAQQDADHELLLQVEKSVRRRLPDALAPAELLVSEMNTAIRNQANP